MLIAFSLENYRNFKERQTLNFTASSSDEHSQHVVELPNGLRVSKVAALIGGNGAGKTQLLSAIWSFSSALHNDKFEDLYSPFLLNKDKKKEPSSFEIIITDDENANFLRYGLSIFKDKIISEYLYSRPIKKGARESCIFERYENVVDFKKNEYKKHEQLINPILKETGALITFSRSLEIPELFDIYCWAFRQITFSPETHKAFALSFIENKFSKEIADNEGQFTEKVVDFLAEYNKKINSCSLGIVEANLVQFGEEGKYRFVFNVPNDDGSILPIGPDYRNGFFSQGTLNVLGFLSTFTWTSSVNFTLYVDEIDTSLHFGLANSLLKYVISEVVNDANTQFVFSTHNIPLIDDCIRRDELNIITKGADGASEIINVSNFAVRKDAKISAKYFRGEFGSLPSFFKDEV
ncbi:AAA family ATPase [Pantoea stewartii]|uniref:AAA family ATPase n=1 Tax=Pantoea stewartii TaxID=66269 RepID=UPI0006D20892|nr:ATP-binding protein [Pantoea stewartii]